MAKFIVRRLGFLLLTMLLVSLAVFLISEAAPGDVARHILGQFATKEQVALLRDQMGLDQPILVRYLDWLAGNDWRLRELVGLPLKQAKLTQYGEPGWFAVASDGTYKQWKSKTAGLVEITTTSDGKRTEAPFEAWQLGENGEEQFWGVDTADHVVLWTKASLEQKSGPASAGRTMTEASGEQYYPIRRGLLRGDPGISLRTNRPVGPTLLRRMRNSFTLALIAFAFIMPIALVLGVVAGLKEGQPTDRGISLFSLITTSIPEFASGVFLILVFAFWLKLLPGAAVFTSDAAPWRQPQLLVLPVLTLTLVEVGYVARMTRASMIEVMNAPYIRTAHLKGLPRARIVLRHAVRNALMAPITVIMLHVNWLIGGIVVVESVFGYPGLGMYLLDSALFKDINAIEAGAMVMVALAVGTQLLADVLYTFLNPRSATRDGRYGLAPPVHRILASRCVAFCPALKRAGDRLEGSLEVAVKRERDSGSSRRGRGRRAWESLSTILRSRVAVVGLLIVLFWVFVAILAPVIAPHDPLAQDSKAINSGPSGLYPLGTDQLGRDILSRLVFGSRTILTLAPISVLFSVAVGTFLGLLGGYLGGLLDEIVMRLLDAIMAFPTILLYLIIISAIGPSALNVVIAITFVGAPGVARLVRSLTLDVRTRDYIRAAETRGENPFFVMFVEILPNARGPLIIDAMLRVGYAIFAIGTLGFLGLGLPPPTPDWGGMISEARKYIWTSPLNVLWPAIAIASLVVGLNLFADGLREESTRYQ